MGFVAMQAWRRGYCLCGSLRILTAKSGDLVLLTGPFTFENPII